MSQGAGIVIPVMSLEALPDAGNRRCPLERERDGSAQQPRGSVSEAEAARLASARVEPSRDSDARGAVRHLAATRSAAPADDRVGTP